MLSFLIVVKGKNGAEHFHEQKQRTVFYAWFAHRMKLVGGRIVLTSGGSWTCWLTSNCTRESCEGILGFSHLLSCSVTASRVPR
jgi:hypothetical protein